jgi:hypothetical protein
MTKVVFAVIAFVAAAAPASAQPRLSNGELRPTAVAGTFNRSAFDALTAKTDAAWFGYSVPMTSGDRRMCCWNDDMGACCGECRLEPGSSSTINVSRGSAGPVPLETGRLLYVLYRIESGTVSKIRMFSDDCALDAGGMTLHWLTGVQPPASVALLATFIDGSSSKRLVDGALAALAMHQEPAALERLIAAARDGSTSHLRGQALFWLAQRAGDKAVGVIAEAITRDPETDVKRRAVFALSQLPKDQGVPLLIQVARTNPNPAVRKQAIFWLGQSKDERALRFFEEILFK